MPEENTEKNIKKTIEKKRWQPVNIILGLLIIGFIFYFCWPNSSFASFIRLIPAIVLILTKKNNIISFIVLFLFGLTIFFLPTGDALLILVSAMYMFFSAILRMFGVKYYIIIGLTIALVLGLSLLWEYSSTFVSENSLTMRKEINNKNGIELVGDTGKISTTFYFNRGISPRGKGLQKGTYAYQVIKKSGEIVVPLNKWPIIKVKTNGDVVQRGVVVNWLDLKNVALRGGFNQDGWFLLGLGDYTVQLVKIEKPMGIIIAESNFSIVPYDKQILSKLTAYLKVDDDPNKYYDSYTKKGNDSVTAWVQSPLGEAISGTVRFFMTNSDGDIEKTSWIGVTENAFRTSIDGEPVSLRNLSGNPLPGIYHYEIIIDGNVVFDLKYNCIPPSL